MVGNNRTQNPGIEASAKSFENNVLWPGKYGEFNALIVRKEIDSATVDAGNTARPSLLRYGFVVSLKADGSITQYDDNNPNVFGVLADSLNMQGRFGGATIDKWVNVLVGGNLEKAGIKLVNADDYAVSALKTIGFRFDDDDSRDSPGTSSFTPIIITGGVSLTSSTPYSSILTGVGAAVTLPSLALSGDQQFELLSMISGSVITSAEGNNIITGGDIAASTLTIDAGESIILRVIKNGATPFWQAITVSGTPLAA